MQQRHHHEAEALLAEIRAAWNDDPDNVGLQVLVGLNREYTQKLKFLGYFNLDSLDEDEAPEDADDNDAEDEDED